MSGDRLPFSRPCLGEDEIREVVEVLRSGWITSGPRVQRFERDFAAYVGADHAVAVTSCTAALHLALLAHGVGPGHEVVTSALTWPATANVVELVGARPVFADVDPGTLQVTPRTIEAVCTPATRAILPVHFAGQACDLEGIGEVARRRGLLVIEDAAHALGTEQRGRRIGSGANTACFSFHPIKNITTGEGGMLTTPDAALAERLRLLRFHGVSRDAWARYSDASAVRYETVLPGFKYNMTDLQAALGIHQLARLDGFIERRAQLAALYGEGLSDVDAISLRTPEPHTTRHAWHLFVVSLELERVRCDRDRFVAMLSELGIGTGLHFTAVHLHRYYRERYGYASGDLPHAERAGDTVFSLPLFPGMTDADAVRVCDAIRQIAKSVRC
jgi:dTDP-4-amino-4,6-dideoxygalactose transaminase